MTRANTITTADPASTRAAMRSIKVMRLSLPSTRPTNSSGLQEELMDEAADMERRE
jgi:hypothetical protein